VGLLLTFSEARAAAFESTKRSDDCRATCRAVESGAVDLARNLPGPRSLDPDYNAWNPDDMDTGDERIVMIADDEDFLDWQRDRLAANGRV
jgi:hypothetical protein